MNLTHHHITDFVRDAKHGDRLMYHLGSLGSERQCGTAFETIHSGAVHMVGLAAFKAAEEGKVRLFQRKIAPSVYEYIAERCIPDQPIEWEGCYAESGYVKPKAAKR